MRKIVLLLLALELLLGACAAQTQVDGNTQVTGTTQEVELPQSGTVELDVFSGRPNPTWTLSDEQTLALGELLGGLEHTGRSAARFDGLGYRGFLVQLAAPESRTISNLYAGNGMVEIETGGEKITYLDPDLRVEKWLLESGKPYLEAGLYDSLLEELN
jgi:hypothetical protein